MAPESDEQRIGRAEEVEEVRVERARSLEQVEAERALVVALLARQRARRAFTIALIGAAVSLCAMSFTLLLAVQVAHNTERGRQNLKRIECLSSTDRTAPQRCPPGK